MSPSWTESSHPGWTKAQAIAAGKGWLVISCGGCRKEAYIPWGSLRRFPYHRPANEAVSRLVCSRCGQRADPASARAWGSYDDTAQDAL